MSVAVNEILSLSFKGRASRGAYWRTLAALAVLAAAGGLALDSLSGLAGGGAAQKGLDLLIWGGLLFLAAFLVSAVVRRAHDISYERLPCGGISDRARPSDHRARHPRSDAGQEGAQPLRSGSACRDDGEGCRARASGARQATPSGVLRAKCARRLRARSWSRGPIWRARSFANTQSAVSRTGADLSSPRSEGAHGSFA